jgi:hypothetical protein
MLRNLRNIGSFLAIEPEKETILDDFLAENVAVRKKSLPLQQNKCL